MISSLIIDDFFNKYPNLFLNFNGSFNIKNGWLNIIEDLFLALHYYCEEENIKINILNVEKKFGILHIEYRGGNLFCSNIIKLAERFSYTTCEECGNKATLCSINGTPFSSLMTLCDKHSLLGYKKINVITSCHHNLTA